MKPRIRYHLVIAFVVLASPATAQVSPGDSTALVSITQTLLDAITNGDSAAWARHLSRHWFITDEEGVRHTRADFLKQLRGLPPGQSGRLQLAERHLVGRPGVVVLSYDIDEWHDYHGQQLRTRFHSTDTWVREDRAWKMLASQVTALPSRVANRHVPRELLERYAGTYAVTADITLRIVAADSGLSIHRSGRQPDRLYALDDRIFVRHGARGFWLFEQDNRGDVVRLVHWRDNNPVVWRRSDKRVARPRE